VHIIAVHIVVLQLTEQTPVVDALHTLKQHAVILMLTGQTQAVDVHHIPQHHVATDTEHVPYAHHMDLQAVVLLILKQHVVLPIAHITTHAAERTAQASAVQVIGAITSYTSCTVCAANNQCTYCNGYGSCTVCAQYNQCTYCNGYTYGPNASCGCATYFTASCSCQDHHKIDLVKKVGGTETVVDSTVNLTTNIQGIKVTLSGNNITAQAYSDTNLTSQVGSTLSQTHPGQKSKEHGIISRASNASQGYTIDEFRVN